jgi:hypothetical protein
MERENFDVKEAQVSELYGALEHLTVFEEKSVFVNEHKQSDFKAIWNPKENKAIAVMSKQFALIQNGEAFKVIIDSLAATGKENVKFKLQERNGSAWLYVVFPELMADDGESKIELGFRVRNSVNGTSALTFSADRKFTDTFVEVFGRRLICGNGMTIKVPLADMIFTDFLVKERLKKTVSKNLGSGYIVHKGDAKARLLDLKALVDAIALSIPSIEGMIKEARGIGLERSLEDAKKFLEECGFGERLVEYVLEKYPQTEDLKNFSNYELYNGITFYASHEQKSQNAAETLLKKAQVLLAPARVR